MENASIKRASIALVQAVIILVGIGVLAFLLVEPHLEGRNAHATFWEIYFQDPFLVYAYTASIPFFVGLYQAFTLAGYGGGRTLVSPRSVQALRTIRYCAASLVAFVLGAELYLIIVQRGKDDIAGGVAMGLFVMAFSLVIAAAAAVYERSLRAALSPLP